MQEDRSWPWQSVTLHKLKNKFLSLCMFAEIGATHFSVTKKWDNPVVIMKGKKHCWSHSRLKLLIRVISPTLCFTKESVSSLVILFFVFFVLFTWQFVSQSSPCVSLSCIWVWPSCRLPAVGFLDIFLMLPGCRLFLAGDPSPLLTLGVPARSGCELWGNTGAD